MSEVEELRALIKQMRETWLPPKDVAELRAEVERLTADRNEWQSLAGDRILWMTELEAERDALRADVERLTLAGRLLAARALIKALDDLRAALDGPADTKGADDE